MSGFLLTADYTSYFNFDSLRGISLCLGLILLGLAIIAVATVAVVKKDKLKLASLIVAGVLLAYAVAIAIANVAIDFKDGETYTQKYQTIIIAVLAVLILSLTVLLAMIDRKKRTGKQHTMSVVYAAICVALAFGLSYIRLFKAPYGGSITLFSLLPIALYSYIFGIRKGVLCGFVYGMLQAVQDPWVVHPLQFILDYPLAFSLVGLCGGLFRNLFRSKALINKRFSDAVAITLGITLGVIGRFMCHMISGAVYFGEYAEGFGFANEWLYSFVYQCTYVLPDGAIAIFGAFVLMMSKAFRNQMDKVIAVYNKAAAHKPSEQPAEELQCETAAEEVDSDKE
ncbi:MAG: energy-coupled thiamine transporter ThiT [Clostridia bacterium]|nr:energy-coupled thiamine transporter ThiT [Clostridia bacterium]